MVQENPALTRKDFTSDQSVKWCPGCGDYNILSAIQATLPKLGKKKEDFCFISGIGCSSRFPYYMNTYGFHTIHGRAPAIATGVKAANPELDVWMITGDGDALSIGGNHFIHAIRRNQDIKIMLFNNRIYGLTKGQYSPTSQEGIRTSSTPYGAIDYPLNPLALTIASNGGFIARTSDNDPKHMQTIFERAAAHKGNVVIEILQNCVIFNDKVHEEYYGRGVRGDQLLYLENGQPMLFGKEKNKGLILDGLNPMVVDVTEENKNDIIIHDESNTRLGELLIGLHYPEFPVPVGIFRVLTRPTYDELLIGQMEDVQAKQGKGQLKDLFQSGTTWEV
jgi:2-oxoglutarate ferredoxin oxidoreductase subunit beta